MFCAKCGKEINDEAVVCVNCGCTVKPVYTKGEKTFVAALLLCLFLGGFGAHRFYVGKTGTAILQLLLTLSFFLCWVTAIWVLVDLIMIIIGNFKTADGYDLTR